MPNAIQIIKDAGLLHKGNLGDVVMFEHPDYPGWTASSKAGDLTGVDHVQKLMSKKVDAFLGSGMKPMVSPGRAAAVEGLAENGLAKAIRKTITSFGSGWQGLDPEFSISHQQTGMREYLGILKKGDKEVGMMGYSIRPGGVLEQGPMMIFDEFKGKGHGKGLLTEIMREGKKKGAITFRSDPAGLSEEMVHTFQSGERAGIMTAFEEGGKTAYKASLFNLDKVSKAVMKTGEGAAIVNAGTSEMPSVLRATSRIIKSAL